MNTDPENLELPPFPPLVWDDCDWWDGTSDLVMNYHAGLTVTPYDHATTRIPSAAQCDAYTYLLEHEDVILQSVLVALRAHYIKIRPRYIDFLGAELNQLMPSIDSFNDLLPLIDLKHIHIHPWTKNDCGYVGLQFDCTWDQEHGLGVMLCRDRVVDLCGADVSFSWVSEAADQPDLSKQ